MKKLAILVPITLLCLAIFFFLNVMMIQGIMSLILCYFMSKQLDVLEHWRGKD
jgi:hypothetical protein